MIYEEKPDLIQYLDYENDSIFLEPTLFFYLKDNKSYNFTTSIEQLIFGYSNNKSAFDKMQVISDNNGYINLPGYGYLKTIPDNKFYFKVSPNGLSVDIDLFTTEAFDSKMMLKYLQNTYSVRLANNTVLTYIDDIKFDIVTHNYPLLNSVGNIEGARMISNEDIGAMKLHAIHQSGDRYKDFVDMYFLLEHEPLKFYLEAYPNFSLKTNHN